MAEPNQIHVSEPVAAALQAGFVIEPRGVVQLKGKGEARTFLLNGRRREGPQTDGVARGRSDVRAGTTTPVARRGSHPTGDGTTPTMQLARLAVVLDQPGLCRTSQP